MIHFRSIYDAALARPECQPFLALLARSHLYRNWIPRKAVTLFAPSAKAMRSVPWREWHREDAELFLLRHAAPGRLTYQQLAHKHRLVTLSGDLLPLGSTERRNRLLPVLESDLLVEGILVHLLDTVLAPSALLSSPHSTGRSWSDLEAARLHCLLPADVFTQDRSDQRQWLPPHEPAAETRLEGFTRHSELTK